MKFVFLKTGDYLDLEPNNTLIANSWFDYIFSKGMNTNYFAKDVAFINKTNEMFLELNNAINMYNNDTIDNKKNILYTNKNTYIKILMFIIILLLILYLYIKKQ